MAGTTHTAFSANGGTPPRLDRKNRVELTSEVLKRDRRRQLDKLCLAEISAQPSEKSICHPPTGIRHPL